RQALASMALPEPLSALDVGDVEVVGTALEDGQRRLGEAVTGLLDDGKFVVVLGGGHEIAYGSYLGVAGSARVRSGAKLGVLNLDAHFDLRADETPSSGTPFRQMAEQEQQRGADLHYAVLGISQPSNTRALFDTADKLGVSYLLDDDCAPSNPAVDEFVDTFLTSCDVVYLTIDLDVLPAAVAPGVSAPAAYGVPLETIQRVCDRVAASGKLLLCDVAELNPELDVDNRTARTAARLIHRITTQHTRR
ncbi:formimidoylglutamase, partial [Saccharopolyspora sp. NPDC000359]|uniref:formimidoylglutamase n=1 Tax=Saccharopolyspora sp. NPDC000359 TaxID=3154251 RepID=UPI0033228E98